MSVREVTYYIAVCDCCGADATYGDYSAMSDPSDALEWAEDWDTIDGADLCPNCWRYRTDEEAEVGKSDDPVRAHETHPEGGEKK